MFNDWNSRYCYSDQILFVSNKKRVRTKETDKQKKETNKRNRRVSKQTQQLKSEEQLYLYTFLNRANITIK